VAAALRLPAASRAHRVKVVVALHRQQLGQELRVACLGRVVQSAAADGTRHAAIVGASASRKPRAAAQRTRSGRVAGATK
jgi:hypothetical protein